MAKNKNIWRHIGRAATRVAGGVIGGVAGFFAGEGVGAVPGAMLGWQAGGMVGDAAMPDPDVTIQKKNYKPFYIMDSYNSSVKNDSSLISTYTMPGDRGFSETMGYVDTGIKLAGTIAGAVKDGNTAKEIEGVTGGFNMETNVANDLSSVSSKVVPGKTAFSTGGESFDSGSAKKISPLIYNTKSNLNFNIPKITPNKLPGVKETSLLDNIGNFVDLASNGRYKPLNTKIKAMNSLGSTIDYQPIKFNYNV